MSRSPITGRRSRATRRSSVLRGAGFRRVLIAVVVSGLLAPGAATAQTPCTWTPLSTSTTANVDFLGVADDGTGPGLYASPSPSAIAGGDAARWNGATWTTLGLPGQAFALITWDDGTGPALYAGGVFPGGVVRQSGGAWVTVGGGMSPGLLGVTSVNAFAVFDDGSGPALHAAGYFANAGGVPANGIAKWDGTAWFALGGGFTGYGLSAQVKALTVFDDGSGPALYAAGYFTHAGGQPAASIARWDGSTWSALGNGLAAGGYAGRAMTPFDDGTGPALYVVTDSVHKWDGVGWTTIGGSGGTAPLAVFDDGTGPALYKRGAPIYGSQGGGTLVVERLTGGSWVPVTGTFASPPSATPCGVLIFPPCPPGPVLWALAVFDDGNGPALYAGGKFESVGGIPGGEVARLDCGATVSMTWSQAGGPGAPLWVQNANLTPYREYYNVFSTDFILGAPGTGPLFGLWVVTLPNIQFLWDQLMTPVGTAPFHFAARDSYTTWGGYQIPPVTMDGITFDFTGGILGSVSPVTRITVQ